ncbi:MAG: glycosyltransferase [Bacteroidetes bacterium]|nr:glycosyltransferase [Bacteroidota bacterium]
MKIAAVIVTYNRLQLLKECIDSIRRQTFLPNEIIVINNSSTDDTMNWLNTQKDLMVITQENSGGAGGFYTGIKTAYEKGSDWIWCMDDDTFLDCNALMNLHSVIEEEHTHQIGFLYSRVINKNRSINLLNRPGNFYSQNKWSTIENENAISEIDVASFVSILINRTTIQTVGYPNYRYFIYFDDLEYTHRFKGFKNLYIPSSIAYHGTLNQKQNYFEYIINGNNSFFWIRNLIMFYKNKNRSYLLKNLINYYSYLTRSIIKKENKLNKLVLSLKATFIGFQKSL